MEVEIVDVVEFERGRKIGGEGAAASLVVHRQRSCRAEVEVALAKMMEKRERV